MKKSIMLALAVLLVIGITAQGQDLSLNFYNFEFGGGGARAVGMGKAFYGVSDDITGGSWNPAGIYSLDQTIIGVSWSNIEPMGKSEIAALGQSYDHTGGFSDISSFNFVTPVRISGHPFVGSFNYTRNFDVYQQYSLGFNDNLIYAYDYYGTAVIDTVPIGVDIDDVIYGGLNTLNFAFGTRFYDKISAGVAINIYTGHTLSEKSQEVDLVDYHIDAVQTAFVEIDTLVTDSNKFTGVNFTIGFMYNNDRAKYGLVIRTPYNLKVNRKQAIVYNFSANGLNNNSSGATYYDDLQIKYEIPLIVGAGFGYKVKENWLVAADIEARFFSGKKVLQRESIIIDPGGSNVETFNTIDPEWKNVFAVRLGTEYMFEKDFATFPLRAGLGYLPVPYWNAELVESGGVYSIDKTSVTDYRISLGTGIHWEQLKFDVGYSYTFSDLESIAVLDDVYSLKETIKNHNISVSFTGVF